MVEFSLSFIGDILTLPDKHLISSLGGSYNRIIVGVQNMASRHCSELVTLLRDKVEVVSNYVRV